MQEGPGGQDLTWAFTASAGPYPAAAPIDGVITQWRIKRRNDATPALAKLKVLTPAGGNFLSVDRESAPEQSGPGLSTFSTRLPIQAGDFIGLRISPGVGACSSPSSSSTAAGTSGDAPVGGTLDFSPLPSNAIPAVATIEPDADGDQFGDETQDQCPGSVAFQTPPCDRTAPETTITKGAPNKITKSKVRFKFTSNEADATFQCKIDGKPYKACTSPKTVKRLEEGRHKFKVRAVDATGNIETTPAKDKFKVVE